MSTPNKRKAPMLEVRKAVIDKAVKNSKQTDLSKQFKIPRNTICDILSDKATTLKAIEKRGSAKRARFKSGIYPSLEEALVWWTKQVRTLNLPVSGELIKEKALGIATLLKIVTFEASSDWMDGFKQRHGIVFKSTQGKSGKISVASLQNAEVPLEYVANKKGCMTDWLGSWNKKLKKAGREVLLYVDDCFAHPQNLEVENITIKFFPPNTTAMSPPMDKGVIQNLKVHYRLRERIKVIDEKKDILVNLFCALHLLHMAWSEVKPETIANCFRLPKFVIKTEVTLSQISSKLLTGYLVKFIV